MLLWHLMGEKNRYDGSFNPAKMKALYESVVPDSVSLDREEVKRLGAEGKRSV